LTPIRCCSDMPNHFDFCPLCFDTGKDLLGVTDSQRAKLEAYHRNKLRTKDDRIDTLERELGRLRCELDEKTKSSDGVGGAPETREPSESATGEIVNEKAARPSEQEGVLVLRTNFWTSSEQDPYPIDVEDGGIV